MLGVIEVSEHSKYLGLPTLIGKSKRAVFVTTVERVMQKMKDWKEKTLSQAGKEVLIKAVIQTIPSYSMNCFLLPITICQDIERATARFFWGSTIEDRKCHWASWETLTTPKAGGGIGFRELHCFNLAMLAKQFWGLLQHPESTTFRILKAKYFPRVDLLDAQLGFKPSFLWRSLIASKSLVQAGMAWRIGDGKQTKTSGDNWIGIGSLRSPTIVRSAELHHGTVDMLINEHPVAWKRELIVESFSTADARAILAMPLGQNLRSDRRIWQPNKNGFFTVKTAYHLAVKLFSTKQQERASSSVAPREWKQMWKINTIPRVKLFLWRACTNSLPTKFNLCNRGCHVDPICILCGYAVETIDHLLVTCSVVVPVWCRSVLRINTNQSNTTSFKDLVWTRLSSFPNEYLSLFAFTAWEIWKTRNGVCFENKQFIAEDVISRAYTIWNDYTMKQDKKIDARCTVTSNEGWTRPNSRKLKLNCDAATWKTGSVGLGFILRDEFGNALLAGKTECMVDGNSTLLEALAVRYALLMLKQYQFGADVIEIDCKSLIDALNNKVKPEVYCDVIINDILDLVASSSTVVFQHVRRQGNQVAHYAARGPDFISIRHTPEHLSYFLSLDVMN